MYTSVEADNYNAFPGSLDCGVGQQDTFQTSMSMLGPSSDPSGTGASETPWWEMPGADSVGVGVGSGDWRPAPEYDSDSSCVTNGQCTTPESDEGGCTSESTDVAPALASTDAYSAVGLHMNPAVGMYTQQLPPPQMPILEPFVQDAYRNKQEALPIAPPRQLVTPYPVQIGATPLHVNVQDHAPRIGPNLLKTKAPVRKRRSMPAGGRMSAGKTEQVTAEATSAALSPKLDAPTAADGTCCPFCKAAFAGGEAGAIPAQEQAGSKKKATSSSGGEEIRQRCLRHRKDVRRHNRQGKWWSSVGYNGEPYCQRCSEIFRDHIIRTMSNSAKCTREHPCHDCEQILRCFTGGRENAFHKMDERRSKTAPGHKGPYKRRKRGQR
eukprot:COSAG02_NODE_6162_length_3756_cov_27.047033_2_plen_381_part_00